MNLLLDSSILIAAEKKRFDLAALVKARKNGEVFIASIVASEILFGCERAATGKRRDARFAYVEDVLATFPILDFDFEIARTHASLGARLAAKGIGIGAHDLIIAATCMHHDLELATLNTNEFARIAGLRLATVVPYLVEEK